MGTNTDTPTRVNSSGHPCAVAHVGPAGLQT